MIWISTKPKMIVKKNKCPFPLRSMLLPRNKLNKLQRNKLKQLSRNNQNQRNNLNLSSLRQQLQWPLKLLQSQQKLLRKLLRIGMMMKMKD